MERRHKKITKPDPIRICLTKKLWLKEVNRKLKAGKVTIEMMKSGKLC